MGGGGSTYDYGFRIYNPALGRFLSVDPLTAKFSFYTPYQFSGNKPICSTDIDGLEDIFFMDSYKKTVEGKNAIEILNEIEIGKEIMEAFSNLNPDKKFPNFPSIDGKVNNGTDVFILTAGASGAGGNSRLVIDNTKLAVPVIDPETGEEMLDDNGDVIRNVYYTGEAYAKEFEEKKGENYEVFKKAYGEEFVDSKDVQNSLKNGRKIAVVVVDPKNATYSEQYNGSEAKTQAYITGHELGGHILNISRALPINPKQEHMDFNGVYGDYTYPGDQKEGTPGQQLNKQIQNYDEK